MVLDVNKVVIVFYVIIYMDVLCLLKEVGKDKFKFFFVFNMLMIIFFICCKMCYKIILIV